MSFKLYRILLPLLAGAALLYGQAGNEKAVVNGKPVSLADLQSLLTNVPPEAQKQLGGSADQLFEYYGFIDKLAGMAEKEKLGDESPYRQQLEIGRKQVLANAMMEAFAKTVKVTAADKQAYYDSHKDQYTTAKVLAIYVPFEQGKEAAARTQADALWKRATAGAGFAALAKEHPADAAKGSGAMPPIGKIDSSIPEFVRTAIFALKPGGITKPLELPSGFYIFELEEIVVKPFPEVENDVAKAVSDERFNTWMENVRKSVTVTKN